MLFLSKLLRQLRRGFERSGIRPLGIVVFTGSVFLLIQLESGQLDYVRAGAVARAQVVEHPAIAPSFVSKVLVSVGDSVISGTPLAVVSSRFIDRELALIDGEIEQLQREAALARSRLAVEEESWLDSDLRRRPSRPSVLRETESLYAARLFGLEERRRQLLEDQLQLVVESRIAGRVTNVLSVGAAVDVGVSIASVTPEHAEEIVAYAPTNIDPARIGVGVEVRVLNSKQAACRGAGRIARRGSGVEQAPAQLENFMGIPKHGLPVFVSIPEGCELGVGQVLSVEFPMEHTG